MQEQELYYIIDSMKSDLNVLISHANVDDLKVREVIKRLSKVGNLAAQNKMEDVWRKERPCGKCGSRGYLGSEVDAWSCGNEGTEKCPYCNGRGHSPDR